MARDHRNLAGLYPRAKTLAACDSFQKTVEPFLGNAKTSLQVNHMPSKLIVRLGDQMDAK